MHIQRNTHTQAHMYSQHTREMATTRHRSLVERGGRRAFVRDKGLAPTKKKGKKGKKMLRKPHIHESKEQGFEHIEPLAKVLHYFLRSDKSNINQKGQIG